MDSNTVGCQQVLQEDTEDERKESGAADEESRRPIGLSPRYNPSAASLFPLQSNATDDMQMCFLRNLRGFPKHFV